MVVWRKVFIRDEAKVLIDNLQDIRHLLHVAVIGGADHDHRVHAGWTHHHVLRLQLVLEGQSVGLALVIFPVELLIYSNTAAVHHAACGALNRGDALLAKVLQ